MISVAENVKTLYQSLPPEKNIRVVAVSKYASIPQMLEAYDAGIQDFGENKIQDLERKIQALPQAFLANVQWHFLGHLQRNKAAKTLTLPIALIHSLDSVALAEKLSALNEANGTCQSVLLQVNLTQEPQKTGFSEEDLFASFSHLVALKGIAIMGLMAMGPHTPNAQESKHYFCHLKELRNNLNMRFGHPLPELSMGMSEDYVHAIECGATIIRVGNRLFAS